MRQKHVWGGGPEIIALSTYLQRPILLYQIQSNYSFKNKIQLYLYAQFGYSHYSNKYPIMLLFTNGKFPNIQYRDIPKSDHFLAVFQCTSESNFTRSNITTTLQQQQKLSFRISRLLQRAFHKIRHRFNTSTDSFDSDLKLNINNEHSSNDCDDDKCSDDIIRNLYVSCCSSTISTTPASTCYSCSSE